MNPAQLYIEFVDAEEGINPAEVAEAQLNRWLDMGGNRAFSRVINMLVVHCSATPNDPIITAADIRKWHKADNGWDDIGYHYVIRRDGMIEKGRKDNVIGSHAAGFNLKSVGICLIGNDEYTVNQIAALQVLLKVLKKTYEVADKNIVGHYELNPHKTCPNLTGEYIRSLAE